MKTLIVGLGALGGTIAARGLRAGMKISLATRSQDSANKILKDGLRVSGIGGDVTAHPTDVKTLEAFQSEKFDWILLATKAHDALAIAPRLAQMLLPGGSLLPIQNGGVSQILDARLGGSIVLGGLSNLAATLIEPGIYRQSNAGHILIGELHKSSSNRAYEIGTELQKAIGTRVTHNIQGSIWSKLLLNCSVTTLGAIAGQTMRQYVATPVGKDLFRRVYDETLLVARASGSLPEKMIVDPIPSEPYDEWMDSVLGTYGDLKASMLQDFERKRRTEIDFINGYVAEVGDHLKVPTPLNSAITEMVHRIENHELSPNPALLEKILKA